MKVVISFLERFRESMLNSIKTLTSRTKRMGKEGDTFEAFGATFQLTDVRRITLFYVANHAYRQEGMQSKEEFIEVWKQIHPRKGYDPNQLVWVHQFKKIEANL
jgi:uncharacterized protein YqfB (UPF0267 family)